MSEKTEKSNQSKEIPSEALEWKPDYSFIPKGRHTYRQHGPYLICKSCQLEHAIYVGIEQIMIGENEEGEPILEKRSVVMNEH